MSIESTASKGDRLDTLRALRDRLAKKIDETESGRDIAALASRLTDVLIQIDALESDGDTQKEEDSLADLIALPGATG